MNKPTPSMTFLETDGIEHLAGGNTFRHGMQYSNDLRVGTLVDIVDADGDIIATLEVEDVFTGNLGDMIAKHATNNYEFRKPHSEARRRDIMSAMQDYYPDAGIDRMSPFSVIYFKADLEDSSAFIEDDAADQPVEDQSQHKTGVSQLASLMANVNSDITGAPSDTTSEPDIDGAVLSGQAATDTDTENAPVV